MEIFKATGKSAPIDCPVGKFLQNYFLGVWANFSKGDYSGAAGAMGVERTPWIGLEIPR